MNSADRPLWQLLLAAKTAVAPQRPLTCAECFAILEYLAEALTQESALERKKELLEAIRQHLAVCPDCQRHYQARLDAMEQAYRLLNKP